jgi:prepilin peptidase CpaA
MSAYSLIPLLFALSFPICMTWAAVTDALTMTISNRLNLVLACAFVPVALLLHLSLGQWGMHLGIGAAGFVIGLVLFAFNLVGGGDAKLLAAAALWFDRDGFLAMLIYTALAGGLQSLVILSARKTAWAWQAHAPQWMHKHLDAKGPIPYGIAICTGGLFAIFHGDLWPLLMH